jgi:hypothetical protein
MGNEEEVLRGDQGMEVKQRKWTTPNRLSHTFSRLSAISSYTYDY